MNQDIRDAARKYIYPNNSSTFAFDKKNLDNDGRKQYGEIAWKEACQKARTEYYFGSSAVKW